MYVHVHVHLLLINNNNIVINVFRFNLITENFSQTLAYPPDSYKKDNITYHFKKYGRMIQVSATYHQCTSVVLVKLKVSVITKGAGG